MPLVTSKDMLLDARRAGYAIAAFNIENMEMALAVLEAAEETGTPVIMQTTPATLRYAPPAVFAGIISALASRSRVPVVMHLDHGSSLDWVSAALNAGYTSAMIDGSSLSFEENVAVTREAVRMAAERIPIEGELGRVGGKEDDVQADCDANTDPDQAAAFAGQTGANSLAVSIGTAHGFYAKAPVLDKQRLSEIRAALDIPLVLHGASGLSDEDIRDCVALGICKVNFATELRVAYTAGVKQALDEDPNLFDPKKLGAAGMERVKKLAGSKMMLCSQG